MTASLYIIIPDEQREDLESSEHSHRANVNCIACYCTGCRVKHGMTASLYIVIPDEQREDPESSGRSHRASVCCITR